MPLDEQQIAALLERKTRGSGNSKPAAPQVERKKFLPEPQRGPVRHYDREMRCTRKGCNSPTYFKFQHLPECMIHVIQSCNELLVLKGVIS